MAPTRRQLLRGVSAGSLASAGLLARSDATDNAAAQADATFCPAVEVSNLRARVRTGDAEPAPESVRLYTADGTVHEFTEHLEDVVECGYWTARDAHWIGDGWNGVVDRVEVSNGRRTVTVANANDTGLEVTCSLWRGPDGASDFTTVYEHATKRYDPAAGDVHVYGSPGRRLQAVLGPAADLEVRFGDRECEPDGERAVRFDCTTVTVDPAEFVDGNEAVHRARLYFADGTDQAFDPGEDAFHEPPVTFAGTDEHEGAAIERLELWNDPGGGSAFLYENPELEACLEDDGASDGVSIASVSVEDGPHRAGDDVDATVTIAGGGADDGGADGGGADDGGGDSDAESGGELFLGFSALGPDGGVYTNDGTTGRVASLGAAETTTATATWTVEADVPAGSYDAHVALWAETDPDALETQLDDQIVEGAFTVGEEGDGGDDSDGDGTVDAAIESVSVDEGPHDAGQDVEATVTVENAGTTDHEFFVGYSALAPDGVAYTNDGTTGQPVSVGAGETASVTVTWTVEDGAPSGTYGAHVAVWAESDPDALETQLDDWIVDSAFEAA